MKEINPDEEFNKKEISNLIESINNYSIRKLNNVNYMPRHNFLQKVKIEEKKTQKTTNKPKYNKLDMRSVFSKYSEMKMEYQKKDTSKESIETFKKVYFII